MTANNIYLENLSHIKFTIFELLQTPDDKTVIKSSVLQFPTQETEGTGTSKGLFEQVNSWKPYWWLRNAFFVTFLGSIALCFSNFVPIFGQQLAVWRDYGEIKNVNFLIGCPANSSAFHLHCQPQDFCAGKHFNTSRVSAGNQILAEEPEDLGMRLMFQLKQCFLHSWQTPPPPPP